MKEARNALKIRFKLKLIPLSNTEAFHLLRHSDGRDLAQIP